MARPRRETKQLFYDTFCEFEVEDQARVLEFLQEFHRQKKRLKPAKTEPVPDPLTLTPRCNAEIEGYRCELDLWHTGAHRRTDSQGMRLYVPQTEASNGGSKQKAIDVSTLDREPGTTDMLRIPKERRGNFHRSDCVCEACEKELAENEMRREKP